MPQIAYFQKLEVFSLTVLRNCWAPAMGSPSAGTESALKKFSG